MPATKLTAAAVLNQALKATNQAEGTLHVALESALKRVAELEGRVDSLETELRHWKPKQIAPKQLIEHKGESLSPKAFAARMAYRLRDIGAEKAYVEVKGDNDFEVRGVWEQPRRLTAEALAAKVEKAEARKAVQDEKPQPAAKPVQAEKPQAEAQAEETPPWEAEETIELAYEG
jgi:hypothetical protein